MGDVLLRMTSMHLKFKIDHFELVYVQNFKTIFYVINIAWHLPEKYFFNVWPSDG